MPSDPPPSNLDEAREILFGGRQRKLERRIGKMEATIAWEKADVAAKIDTLTETLSQRLDNVTAELTERIAALEAELAECQRRLREMQAESGDTGTDD